MKIMKDMFNEAIDYEIIGHRFEFLGLYKECSREENFE